MQRLIEYHWLMAKPRSSTAIWSKRWNCRIWVSDSESRSCDLSMLMHFCDFEGIMATAKKSKATIFVRTFNKKQRAPPPFKAKDFSDDHQKYISWSLWPYFVLCLTASRASWCRLCVTVVKVWADQVGGWKTLCIKIGYSEPRGAESREWSSTLAESSQVT